MTGQQARDLVLNFLEEGQPCSLEFWYPNISLHQWLIYIPMAKFVRNSLRLEENQIICISDIGVMKWDSSGMNLLMSLPNSQCDNITVYKIHQDNSWEEEVDENGVPIRCPILDVKED